MKALIISALLFFSVRAMSAIIGENSNSVCIQSPQNGRKVKVVEKPNLEIAIVKSSKVIEK